MTESDWSKVKDKELEAAFEFPVKSPCVSVCALNRDDICEGCFRSGTEISQWGRMSNTEKTRVLQKCHERAVQMRRVWWTD
ncbi:DUF1289 domain-containing protein [Microbulbifer bruguierae]|uniref:DUF1289 domain-containing protein n=1 Tax=Microbulbifer bruguierae TaxID=3029061 RepID=A0ABY8NFJ5_9GAMM|nr:DUF1289 domain-containing protein [Microbulbifer bruguierae]WGL17714.1 DUF1289 domain-containing protein [Microbulbifer bruguierae]